MSLVSAALPRLSVLVNVPRSFGLGATYDLRRVGLVGILGAGGAFFPVLRKGAFFAGAFLAGCFLAGMFPPVSRLGAGKALQNQASR